jgi:hypothetical protein
VEFHLAFASVREVSGTGEREPAEMMERSKLAIACTTCSRVSRSVASGKADAKSRA